MEQDQILIKGAREHNLKNIDVEIPKKKFVVITGVSGSGKSSLAIDTLFAEGQRRYVESLSSYARQFLGQMEKPKFDTIRGIAPTIAIEQKASSKNPRSTVGTITEIYDYLRVLFARVGTQYCRKCGKLVGRGDASEMIGQIMEFPEGTKLLLLAPIIENRKGEHRDLFEQMKRDGISRVRINGVVSDLADVQKLAKNKKHNIEAVVDRLIIRHDDEFKARLTDSLETALRMGSGTLIYPSNTSIGIQERHPVAALFYRLFFKHRLQLFSFVFHRKASASKDASSRLTRPPTPAILFHHEKT